MMGRSMRISCRFGRSFAARSLGCGVSESCYDTPLVWRQIVYLYLLKVSIRIPHYLKAPVTIISDSLCRDWPITRPLARSTRREIMHARSEKARLAQLYFLPYQRYDIITFASNKPTAQTCRLPQSAPPAYVPYATKPAKSSNATHQPPPSNPAQHQIALNHYPPPHEPSPKNRNASPRPPHHHHRPNPHPPPPPSTSPNSPPSSAKPPPSAPQPNPTSPTAAPKTSSAPAPPNAITPSPPSGNHPPRPRPRTPRKRTSGSGPGGGTLLNKEKEVVVGWD